MQSNGTASYHAFQISARKSMAKHLSLTAFYTFSKSLSSYEMSGQSTSGAPRISTISLSNTAGPPTISVTISLAHLSGTSAITRSISPEARFQWLDTLADRYPEQRIAVHRDFGRDNNYDGTNNDRANLVGQSLSGSGSGPRRCGGPVVQHSGFCSNPIGTDGTRRAI